MKILIDIKHPAQLNLFKELAIKLKQTGWEVTISYLGRGRLPNIIAKEYDGFNIIMVGSSHGTKWSIFWNGNIIRIFTFLKLIFRHKYNICIAASSIPLALACYSTSTPIIQFYDDPERKRINNINAFFSTKLFFPPIVPPSKKVGIFNCLKEWSYLSPSYFTPTKGILEEFALQERNYIFIREVSNKSFNYFDQDDAIICAFSHNLDSSIKVILSLEDKSIAKKYPADWIILQEPVSCIHSLIFYSKLVVSSGDSMAREGAMLGVPSIYCGIREMKANEVLKKEGILFHHPSFSAVPIINSFISKPFDANLQITLRNRLKYKWDDMVQFMKSKIDLYKK